MVMDITGLKALRESPLVKGKQVEEFAKKLNLLTMEEKKASFEVACKDMLSILDQTVPCIGCRRRFVLIKSTFFLFKKVFIIHLFLLLFFTVLKDYFMI